MSSLPRALRVLIRWSLCGLALLALGILACNLWILWRTRDRIYKQAARVPVNQVGLVLGTSPRVRQWQNPFFEGRMDAAARLFHAGKVRRLLLSGDNGQRGYDEPTAMKEALIARGIPASALYLDYAGFRTLDSMARARAVFGLKEVTVVTDDFHLPRALFLARAFRLEAIGYSSPHVPFRWAKKTLAREVCSRVAAFLDIYVLHTQPKFYGPKVEIRLASDDR